MANYVFYDFETTGISPKYDQALQFAAILTDENLNPIEEVDIRCRLADYILPSPIALAVTGVTPDMLFEPELSYYEFTLQLYNLIKKWSPAIWTGYNSISFDENVFRQMFYQNLLPNLYQTQMNGNTRLDLLRAVYACWGFGRQNPKIPELNGKQTVKLDMLAPHNGFNEHNAHDALGDVRATIYIAKLIRNTEPEIWSVLNNNLDKNQLKETLQSGTILHMIDRFGGGMPKTYTGVYCGTSKTNKNQFGFFDLTQSEASDYESPDIEQVKNAVSNSPQSIRTIDLNKMPLIFGAPNPSTKEQNDAALIKNNKALHELTSETLAGRYSDRERSELVEEQIYDGFYSNADKSLLDQFHNVSWDQRSELISQFSDKRLQRLGTRLMINNAPQFVNEKTKTAYREFIKSRWSGEEFYGESERSPGNTYQSVADDLKELKVGGKFEVPTKDLILYKYFFHNRKIN